MGVIQPRRHWPLSGTCLSRNRDATPIPTALVRLSHIRVRKAEVQLLVFSYVYTLTVRDKVGRADVCHVS